MSPERPADDRLFGRVAASLVSEYRLARELGRGGMGIVYLAHDLQLDRPVAIKVLPPSAEAPQIRALRARSAHRGATIAPTHRADLSRRRG